jgi:LPS sulfotransferase NodH
MSQAFVILTHVRSGSSLLADMLTRHGIGEPEEHLNVRFLAKRGDFWNPVDILAAARGRSSSDFFGSKVMVHWLDDLKQHSRSPAATDTQILNLLFGEQFATIYLYRADTVAAAVSFTLAELGGQWHRTSDQGHAETRLNLPRWDAMNSLISDNVAWLDACKDRLRNIAAALTSRVVEMKYEDLSRDPATELRRAAEAILGEQAAGRELTAKSNHRKLADARSEELRQRWLAEHRSYAASQV